MSAKALAEVPSTFEQLVAEVRRLKTEVGRNLWRMGHYLRRLEEREENWKPKYKRWDVFTQDVLGLTGHYTHKLMDVADAFSERDVLECGATKLIRILPVPQADRPAFVAQARTGSCSELRASLNKYTLGRVQSSDGGVLPTRDTGRKHQMRTRGTIAYLEPREQLVALYAGVPLGARRAKRVEDKPVGRVLLGGKAYVLSLRSTDQGLVVAVGLEPKDP